MTKFKINIDNNTLSIVEKRYNIFDKGAIENIKVFIPKSFEIDNFNINSSSGSITMSIENEINNLKIKVDISKSIQNVENKIKNESEERKYQIDKLNSLTEYDKIILKNLESRIAILEEETENYN